MTVPTAASTVPPPATPPPAPPEVSWGEAWKATKSSPLHVQAKKAWVHGVLAIVCTLPLGVLGAIVGIVFAQLAWKRAKELRAQVDPHPGFHPRIKAQLRQAYIMSMVAAGIAALQVIAWLSSGAGSGSVAGPASGCVGNDANDAFVCWT